jgi:hypothetical protein
MGHCNQCRRCALGIVRDLSVFDAGSYTRYENDYEYVRLRLILLYETLINGSDVADYASVVYVGFGVISAVWYFISEH